MIIIQKWTEWEKKALKFSLPLIYVWIYIQIILFPRPPTSLCLPGQFISEVQNNLVKNLHLARKACDLDVTSQNFPSILIWTALTAATLPAVAALFAAMTEFVDLLVHSRKVNCNLSCFTSSLQLWHDKRKNLKQWDDLSSSMERGETNVGVPEFSKNNLIVGLLY